MKESLLTLSNVAERANANKYKLVSTITTMNGYTSNVEETNRRAGRLDVVARLTSAFARLATIVESLCHLDLINNLDL